ncbi:MAG TPA: SUMF1/EgtB/PvdO family nonheme iron enzyme, partial [Burkholderiaceae bacterium]|nr:SUMF1/EgtB/PvdO family nonheme iron enzyme [Burkholderiaceae bacterium]
MPHADGIDIDSPAAYRAGRDELSLALIDARNCSLRWLAAFEQALGPDGLRAPQAAEVEPPLWTLGHLAWFQVRWVARNLQRARGAACDPSQARLAGVLTRADEFYDPEMAPAGRRAALELPDAAATRQYLVDTLETTLELLAGTGDGDDALYFHRLALWHEDRHGEALATLSQTLGFDSGLLAWPPPVAPRAPLFFPATVHELGARPGGFVIDNEQWAHEVALPEFEIDAQAVSWSQYAEFVEDGGYDEPRWWSREGWDWIDRLQRRSPRHVEQLRHGVLARRFGKLARVPLAQPATHLAWYEADAWCRWAGRRLPTEVEWDHAAA